MLAVALLVSILMAPALIRKITGLVIVADEPRDADLIYVLNGRFDVRVELAARLYHDRIAPRILIAHTQELAIGWRGRLSIPLSEVTALNISYRGVPVSALEIIPFEAGVVNTRDEAIALRQYIERNPARRIIVVTTEHHTGRARHALLQELRGLDVELQMAAAADNRGFTAADWWRSSRGRRVYLGELLKLGGTLLRLDRR